MSSLLFGVRLKKFFKRAPKTLKLSASKNSQIKEKRCVTSYLSAFGTSWAQKRGFSGAGPRRHRTIQSNLFPAPHRHRCLPLLERMFKNLCSMKLFLISRLDKPITPKTFPHSLSSSGGPGVNKETRPRERGEGGGWVKCDFFFPLYFEFCFLLFFFCFYHCFSCCCNHFFYLFFRENLLCSFRDKREFFL